MSQEFRYSVSELNQVIRRVFENAPFFQNIFVEGEVSNLTQASSGHWYFSLKENNSQINCTMWRSFTEKAPKIQNGDLIEIRGSVNIFEAQGKYQIQVTLIKKKGIGDLFESFLQLKSKLEKDGWFDVKWKKPIPKFPKSIGIVTSATGDVINDIYTTIARRYPTAELILAPATVQGNLAPESCIRAINQLVLYSVDVIIIARGGGSFEDLFCFNHEILVKAIAQSPIPIITGIGHEPDFTLADFAGSLRAPTPTAAAELATPNLNEWLQKAEILTDQILQKSQQKILNAHQELTGYQTQITHQTKYRLLSIQQFLDSMSEVSQYLRRSIELKKLQLNQIDSVIEQQDYQTILKKGFTLIHQNNKIVKKGSSFNKNADTEITFYDQKIIISNQK
jgi:exodeoxyribonuclease VII large subunit